MVLVMLVVWTKTGPFDRMPWILPETQVAIQTTLVYLMLEELSVLHRFVPELGLAVGPDLPVLLRTWDHLEAVA